MQKNTEQPAENFIYANVGVMAGKGRIPYQDIFRKADALLAHAYQEVGIS